jgi:hypothetical protein
MFQNNFLKAAVTKSLNDIKKIQSLNTLSSPASKINKKVQDEVRRLVEYHQQKDNRTGSFTTGSEV